MYSTQTSTPSGHQKWTLNVWVSVFFTGNYKIQVVFYCASNKLQQRSRNKNYFWINFVDSGLEAWKVAMAVVIPVVLVILLAIVGIIAYLKYGKKRNNGRGSYKPGYENLLLIHKQKYISTQSQNHFQSFLLSIM